MVSGRVSPAVNVGAEETTTARSWASAGVIRARAASEASK
jgi:hypothetical protein